MKFSSIFFWLLIPTQVLFLASCQPSRGSATYPDDEKIIAEGRQLFEINCAACHNFNAPGIGPNLSGVTREVTEHWLKSFIRNPAAVIDAKDERAVALFASYKQYMPPFSHLDESSLDAILAYMHTFERVEAIAVSDSSFGTPIENPVPEPIPMSSQVLLIREVGQAPRTAEGNLATRINKMYPMLPGSGRTFISDLRGQLYEWKEGEFHLFMDIVSLKPLFIHVPGLATGFGSFAFHPEFLENGLLYTTHTEDPEKSAPADFGYADSIQVKVRWVLTEWKIDDPNGETFSGTGRELFRADMVTQVHGVQEIIFRPTAKKGDEDYGLLYIGVGDGGATLKKYLQLTQDPSKTWGTILRIEPTGNNSENGNYGIPETNPFAAFTSSGALGEIYAYGFRNPHRITWDEVSGNMLASDIGERSIEEVNIIQPGANYGWPDREGTFRLNKYGDIHKVYPLDSTGRPDEYTYPVLQFDHDEAGAISGGFVYQGNAVPGLRGKYLFGGIVNGRIFAANTDAMQPGVQIPMEELSLQLSGSQETTTLRDLTGINRVDLRFGLDASNELYIFTKPDGKVYQIVGMKNSL